MLFEWDSKKATSNLKKHKVPFEMACTVFNDPFHLSIIDPDYVKEERWVTIGRSADDQTLIVVHTDRVQTEEGEVIRLISAKKATKKEKKEYAEGI